MSEPPKTVNARDKPSETLNLVRGTVRSLLLASPAFRELQPARKTELASAMVKVCHTAAELIREEMETAETVKAHSGGAQAQTLSAGGRSRRAGRPTVALAQNAGSDFSGVAASKVAGTTRAILNAVSFPRFVTELINGVFRAMLDSSQEQMRSYVELLNNVAASTEGFAESTMSDNRARQWLVDQFPGSFELARDEEGSDDGGPPATTVQLREGATTPSEAAMRASLGIPGDQSVPTGDPDRTLVPFAKLALARQRQQMLATLVMLGMQRIVIESGRINASMRFHIDTRSAAQDEDARRFSLDNEIKAEGSFSVGPWGASASVRNEIAYVSTQKSQTTEEMNTDLDLNSSVELIFKTDYVPLDRLAGKEQTDRIRVNTLNPEAEEKAAYAARAEREKRYAESDRQRSEAVDKELTPTRLPAETPRPTPRPEPTPQQKKDQAQPRGSNETTGKSASGEKAKGAGEKTKASEANAKTGTKAAALASDFAAASPGPSANETETASAESTPIAREPDVKFVPSRDEAAIEMLRLADVQPGELVYDLGSGDGRIVTLAAKLFGCRAVGVEIDPARISEARRNIRRHGVDALASIVQQDLFSVDLSEADVVTLYLLPKLNVRLIPQLEQMKPGARVVSQDFDMAGIVPDRVVQLYFPAENIYKNFYLWTVPLKKSQRAVPHEWREAAGIYR